MCSVSIIPRRGGLRIACNRDEQRTRPLAEPPMAHRAAGRVALWPVDPVSGGTWIGANDAGLAMVLLNRFPHNTPAVRQPSLSRGCIIPRLLAAADLRGALDALSRDIPGRLSPRVSHRGLVPPGDFPFAPFTLVMIQGAELAVVTWSAGALLLRHTGLLRPQLFTSSSLGGDAVVSRRRSLFSQFVLRSGMPMRGQARFHHHQWPDRPDISVLMSRRDAATVSTTVLDVSASAVRMHYQPISHKP